MSWQDREYAKGAASYRPAWSAGGYTAPGRRSIVTMLIIANVVVFMLGSLGPAWERAIYGYGAMQGLAVLHGQLWRLFTAQYLHAGTWHILLNMIGLHFLGRPLERMWTARKFFTIYTLCGLIGNVFYTILGAQGVLDPRTLAVGASGSIYGLLGIVAVLFPTATVYVYFLFPIRIRTAAMVFGAIALLSILSRGANYGGEACHLAGLVFGVWWAMKGDAWWAGTQWRRPRRASRVRAARSTSFEAKIAQRRQDEETIDRILKKVYDGGIHSLTDREKQALQAATERRRQREADAGRVDRL